MPQMVGIFNGFGGGASAIVAIVEFIRLSSNPNLSIPMDTSITTILGVIIGGVTFSGSMVAFGKLQGIVSGAPITFPLQKIVNALVMIAAIVFGVYIVGWEPNLTLFYVIVGLSLVYGVLFVIPIGCADMPVVISLLNSFSGLAACAAGFVVKNNVWIFPGYLEASPGLSPRETFAKG